MKYGKEELDGIIYGLKKLVPNINTLPAERFCDIWNELDITVYKDVKTVEREIPELKEYIRICVTELDFDKGIT
jgi:hypothetical protein